MQNSFADGIGTSFGQTTVWPTGATASGGWGKPQRFVRQAINRMPNQTEVDNNPLPDLS